MLTRTRHAVEWRMFGKGGRRVMEGEIVLKGLLKGHSDGRLIVKARQASGEGISKQQTNECEIDQLVRRVKVANGRDRKDHGRHLSPKLGIGRDQGRGGREGSLLPVNSHTRYML